MSKADIVWLTVGYVFLIIVKVISVSEFIALDNNLGISVATITSARKTYSYKGVKNSFDYRFVVHGEEYKNTESKPEPKFIKGCCSGKYSLCVGGKFVVIYNRLNPGKSSIVLELPMKHEYYKSGNSIMILQKLIFEEEVN